MRKTVEQRFWEKVDKRGEDECWNWQGATTATNKGKRPGYGVITVEGSHVYTHRFSFELHNGYIAPDLLVCHECDNGLCVNPKHLWQGTYKENYQDMHKKGRWKIEHKPPKPKPERHGRKLTLSQVRELKRLRVLDPRTYTLKVLGKMFGVHFASVSKMVRGHYWKED